MITKPPLNNKKQIPQQNNNPNPNNTQNNSIENTKPQITNNNNSETSKVVQHNIEMNCLQNCSIWSMKVKIIAKEQENTQNHNDKIVDQSEFKEPKNNNNYSNNPSIAEEANYTVEGNFTGKNYFLNKLMLNYASLLSDFNYFKLSASFLDIFFVKSMQQNKDKIEFIKITPNFPLDFSLLAQFDKSNIDYKKDFLKFFVDFDLTKNDILSRNLSILQDSQLVLNVNASIHSLNLFGYDHQLVLEGAKFVEIIKKRIFSIKNNFKESNYSNSTNSSNNNTNNSSSNKAQQLKQDLNEAFCSVVSNDNFNLGVIIRVDDSR